MVRLDVSWRAERGANGLARRGIAAWDKSRGIAAGRVGGSSLCRQPAALRRPTRHADSLQRCFFSLCSLCTLLGRRDTSPFLHTQHAQHPNYLNHPNHHQPPPITTNHHQSPPITTNHHHSPPIPTNHPNPHVARLVCLGNRHPTRALAPPFPDLPHLRFSSTTLPVQRPLSRASQRSLDLLAPIALPARARPAPSPRRPAPSPAPRLPALCFPAVRSPHRRRP